MPPALQLENQKFGKLKVLHRDVASPVGKVKWICLCDCGKIASIAGPKLKIGWTKSCGCLAKEYVDLANRRFGRLVAQTRDKSKTRGTYWFCLCDCGEISSTRAQALKAGEVKSCGCLNEELRFLRCKARITNQANFNNVFTRYKKRATRLEIPFRLTKEKCQQLFSNNCGYCGYPPSNLEKNCTNKYNDDFPYNGIDRMDNRFGYLLENCIACCRICNKAKSDMSWVEWLTYRKRFTAINNKFTPMDFDSSYPPLSALPEEQGNEFKELFRCYAKGAKKRGLSFNLTRKQCHKLFQGLCQYCGITPQQGQGSYTYNGIDRIANINYRFSNCVSCCFTCNRGKGNLTLAEWKRWIARTTRISLDSRKQMPQAEIHKATKYLDTDFR